VARAPERARPAALLSPREACGERTQFSLYRCMQTECERPAFLHHPQCERLRSTDSVD
jgi:non-specific serine/threonine protein kinase